MFASLASTREGTVYLVGNDIRNYGPALVPANPLSAWELDPRGDRSLGRPAGTFRFAYPRALIDSRDRLHLLWGEPEGGAKPIRGNEWRDESLTSIWTAVYDSAHGWSVPRPIFEGRNLKLAWHNMLVPVHSQAEPRHAALAVPIDPYRQGEDGMVLVGFDSDDELIASVVPAVTPVAYASVTSVGARTFLGFIAPAPVERFGSDRNSVFLQTSSDGGATWLPPVLVSRSGHAAAYELKTLVAPDGVVHLIWEQEHGGSRVFRHVQSSDDGQTWSVPDDLEPPPSAYFIQAAVDACGTLHLIWEHQDWSVDRAHIDYATRGEHWSGISHLFPSLTVNMPVLHHAHDGRLLLAFQGRPADAPDETAQNVTMYTELMYAQRPVK
ncbi:MAG TPA: hypothetical protein VFK04_08535 [Gemmatimonadaceae bacterium]|nr:hypothetical protein [Gemmatimonadaceae bacterium]